MQEQVGTCSCTREQADCPFLRGLVRAEEQEYRDKVRKQKQQIYDQYLWRKLLIADFQAHSAFMMSPAWEAAHAAKVAR